MEELLEFTKSQLIEAFWQWNKDSLENPEKFSEITASKQCAIDKTEALLKYLQKPAEKPKFSLGFGEALEAIKNGKRATREGWNGKGMFIFMRPADELHIDMVIDKVKSLPQSVKDFYLQDVTPDDGVRIYPADDEEKVIFTAYLCMKDAQGRVVNGWLASQTDILSEDWEILD
jgi:hypothetical protein